jgi:multiple sugar transport system permease protein
VSSASAPAGIARAEARAGNARAEAARQVRARAEGRTTALPLALGIAIVLLWSLGPAVWQALTAIKPDAQITTMPTVYLPHPPTWVHVLQLWERKPFGLYLANSAGVSLAATLLCLAVASLAAAALARLPGRGRLGIMLGLLVISLFPPIMLLFPLYEGVRALHWINHPLALVLPDAALHLPLALPALATTGVLVFIFCWNEFMLALTFMTRDATKTVTAGIASVGGASIYEIPWGQLSAAIVIATVPLIFLVLLFQRGIVSGLTRGALKG